MDQIHYNLRVKRLKSSENPERHTERFESAPGAIIEPKQKIVTAWKDGHF